MDESAAPLLGAVRLLPGVTSAPLRPPAFQPLSGRGHAHIHTRGAADERETNVKTGSHLRHCAICCSIKAGIQMID